MVGEPPGAALPECLLPTGAVGAAGLDGNARNARLDKLCFAGGPWTNAPTVGAAVGMARSTDCIADL